MGRDGIRPDLIVLDLSLPKMDGTEVLEEMRGRFDGTAVLVLTGRSNVEERIRCLNLGADDWPAEAVQLSHELTARCRARCCGGGRRLPIRCCGMVRWS